MHRKSKILFISLSLVSFGVLLCALLVYLAVKDTVKLVKPPATALIEDRYGNFLSEGSSNSTAEIGYWEIPTPLPERISAAFLAIEDKRFYQHSGIDWRSIFRALWNNVTGKKRQGASTIAMQVARIQRDRLTPTPTPSHQRRGDPPLTRPRRGTRTYWHKFCESITALLLIRKLGHEAVLKQYLEIVPQGNRIHGVAYAARRYFRKPLQDLSWAEAAALAALPKAPGDMNLFRAEGRQKAFTRAKLILRQLYQNGILSEENFLAARRQLSKLTIPTKETRPSHSYHAILRLEDALRQTAARYSYTQPIRACLDLTIQEKVNQFADAAINYFRAAGAGNIASIVVEKVTGNVVAYVGSNYYQDEDYAGAINYARVRRSSGSTLKPFIYALGLETQDFSPASLLSDMPITVELPRGYYQIGNFDGRNLGYLIYRKALANSRNVPAIHVLIKVGVEKAYELFRQLGLADQKKPASYYGVGMAIGTLYITLEDLVAAYGVLANDGKAFKLHWFEEPPGMVASSKEDRQVHTEQIMSKEVTRQISLYLSDPMARLPTFQRMGSLEYPFPVAVKTGTSQGFRDGWAVAYSSKYLVGVWIGHPDNTRMKEISGMAAAQVAKQIMLYLHPTEQRGVLEQTFPTPEGYKLVNICALNGGLATDTCPEIIPEYFRPGTEPVTSQPVVYQPVTDPEHSGTTNTYRQFALVDSPNRVSPFEQLLSATILIEEPRSGGTFLIDPDTPRPLQTLSLRAQVNPPVSEIVWQVDGKPFTSVAYPYTARWPLTSGTHTIQARFAHADITSEIVTISVY
jgi:penicillin-binding protein 1C